MWRSTKNRAWLCFSLFPTDSAGSNGHELKCRKFHVNTRKPIFHCKDVVEHWTAALGSGQHAFTNPSAASNHHLLLYGSSLLLTSVWQTEKALCSPLPFLPYKLMCFPHALHALVFRPQAVSLSPLGSLQFFRVLLVPWTRQNSGRDHGEEQLLTVAISIAPQCPFAVSTAVKSWSTVK